MFGCSCSGPGLSGTSKVGPGLVAESFSPVIGHFANRGGTDKSALIQFASGGTTAIDWNVGVAGKCDSISVPDGNFYLQQGCKSTPALSINDSCPLGVGTVNPLYRLCVSGKVHTSCGLGIATKTINTTLAVNGSIAAKMRTVSTTNTLAASDYAVLAKGTITLTLPAANTQDGMMLFIKNTSTSTVSVIPGGSDAIEGASSSTPKLLSKKFDSLMLISNGGSPREWYILSGVLGGVAVS